MRVCANSAKLYVMSQEWNNYNVWSAKARISMRRLIQTFTGRSTEMREVTSQTCGSS